MTAPALLTEAEAAAMLRVCPRTLRRLRQSGAIRYVALTGRTVAYRPEDLQALIEQHTQTCDERTPTRRRSAARQRQGEVIGFTARREQRRGTA